MSAQRRPPREELVNVFEFEDVAKLALPSAVFSTIAGGDRAAFDRMTLRPRMLVPTVDLDLSVELFGDTQFTPILVGPVAEQRRFHTDGELATIRGASAGKATVVVSSRSSVPIAEIATRAKTPVWCAVYADDHASMPKSVEKALASGCKVLCVTFGDGARMTSRVDWSAIDWIRRGVDAAVVIKGVTSVQDAKAAVQHGIRGIVVSNHGVPAGRAGAPIDVLPAIADAVSDKITLLIDGGFRRGSDILKALILGARGVLIARPVMWGLAAYGADGVQTVIEMLQTDLARHMSALGAPNLAALNRNMIRIHKR